MIIEINDTILDLYEGTDVGFSYKSYIFNGKTEKRTTTITVPATATNNELFNFDNVTNLEGQRVSLDCKIILRGGYNYNAKLYVIDYSRNKNEYEVCIVFNDQRVDLPDGKLAECLAFHKQTTQVEGKDIRLQDGNIPDFGFFRYTNGATSSGSVSTSPMVGITPSANLEYIIETWYNSKGIQVNQRANNWRLSDFGIVLPTCNANTSETVTVQGCGVNGFTISGATSFQAAGFEIVARRYKRGALGQNKTVYTLTALTDLTIIVPAGSTQVQFAGGAGYDFLSELNNNPLLAKRYVPTGFEYCIELEAGQWFTLADVSELFPFVPFGVKWINTAFETNINITFEVIRKSETATQGATITLGANLPDMKASELLKCYLQITGYFLDYNGSEITIYDFTNLMQNLNNVGIIETSKKLISVDSLQRWATIINGDTKYVTKDELPDGMRFRRYEYVGNDYLSEKQEVTIPIYGGEITGEVLPTLDLRPFIDNVKTTTENNQTTITSVGGNLYMIYKPATSTTAGANHIYQAICEGMGQDRTQWISTADTISITIVGTEVELLQFTSLSAFDFDGKTWLLVSATYQKEQLKIIAISL